MNVGISSSYILTVFFLDKSFVLLEVGKIFHALVGMVAELKHHQTRCPQNIFLKWITCKQSDMLIYIKVMLL